MWRGLLLAAMVWTVSACAASHGAERITVSAAASMKEALEDVGRAFEKREGVKIDLNLGASGQLAAQIEAGAPVDVLISAAEGPVMKLEKGGRLVGEARVIAGNEIVLIAGAGSAEVTGFDSLMSPGVHRIAVGEPKTVPAGDYAIQVLDALHLHDKVKDKLVYGQNVRQVLDYVIRGEVDAGIVYATDAAEAGEQVHVTATAEAWTHRPVRYWGAVVKGDHEEAAGKFVEFLCGAEGQAVLKRRGFEPGPTTRAGK